MHYIAWSALLLAGCASGGMAGVREQESTSPSDPRAEIAALEGRIATLRGSIGMPASDAPAAAGASASPAEEESARPEAKASAAAPERADRNRGRKSARCHDVSVAADEICSASDRICVLAWKIGDGDAQRSCTRSRDDCRRARDNAGSCE